MAASLRVLRVALSLVSLATMSGCGATAKGIVSGEGADARAGFRAIDVLIESTIAEPQRFLSGAEVDHLLSAEARLLGSIPEEEVHMHFARLGTGGRYALEEHRSARLLNRRIRELHERYELEHLRVESGVAVSQGVLDGGGSNRHESEFMLAHQRAVLAEALVLEALINHPGSGSRFTATVLSKLRPVDILMLTYCSSANGASGRSPWLVLPLPDERGIDRLVDFATEEGWGADPGAYSLRLRAISLMRIAASYDREFGVALAGDGERSAKLLPHLIAVASAVVRDFEDVGGAAKGGGVSASRWERELRRILSALVALAPSLALEEGNCHVMIDGELRYISTPFGVETESLNHAVIRRRILE